MALVLTAALLTPLTAHTVVELQTWEDDWYLRAADLLDQELMAEWREMHDTHPWFYDPKEVIIHESRNGTHVATPSPITAGVEQWRTLVAAYFPADQVDRALRVMACESGGDPNAYNPSGATGLMQILASWADNFGYQPADLYDPDINLHIASLLWADGGWSHWVCHG